MYTLKNIRHSAALSRETLAYTADLCGPDGLIVGLCRNDGGGGETHVRGFGSATTPGIEAARAWCAALPPFTLDMGPGLAPRTVAWDLPTWCDVRVGEWLDAKRARARERRAARSLHS